MKQAILFFFIVATSCSISAQQPAVWMMNTSRLIEVKKKWEQKEKTVTTWVDSLRRQADALLTMKPVSVMDKTVTPVSGNKHDYMSQAPYFWYDSTKPNGLPYTRRDGVRNPEIYKITDRTYLGRLETSTRTLSLAYYFTGDEKYAAKSASLLRHWFLNEETKMNPHLEYGQGIPGINHGRGIGIIETRALIGIADAAGLLQGSAAWTKKDQDAIRQWYKEYLHWLLTSKHGRDEHAAKNNHGTWYYAQTIDFALFTGDHAVAKQLAQESMHRLDSQLTKEGKQPLELERTNGLGYSTMNLRGWFDVASLSKQAGVDLWNHATPTGAGIRTALNWLTPYATGEQKWTYQQISSYSKAEIYTILVQAARQFNDNNYLLTAGKIREEIKNDPVAVILYGL